MKKLIYILLLASFTGYGQTTIQTWNLLRQQQTANTPTPTGQPILTNFRILNSDDDRVYFDATEDVTGLTTQGFTISDVVSITNITIDGDGLGGYFTIFKDVAGDEFDFWSNNTIKLENGDGTVPDFALHYVDNQMVEPPSTNYRYVTASATGGGNGLTEGTAWTLSEAESNDAPNMTIWVKAGDYGTESLSLNTNGTAGNLIKYIGYKNSITDITSNYFDYGVTMDSSEMPTFTAGRNADAVVITADYVIVRNIQVYDSEAGFVIGDYSNVIIDNCNAEDIYSTSGGGYGFVYFGSGTGREHRITNSVAINAAFNFWFEGDYSLMKGNKSYSDIGSGNGWTNYYYSTGGDHSIYLNNYTKAVGDVDGGEHGFSMQNLNSSTHRYCLNEGQVVVNMGKALEVRHDAVDYNVIRGLQTYGEGTGSQNAGGIRIRNNANNNIFENLVINPASGADAISFEEAAESGVSLGNYNIVRNSLFLGGDSMIFASNDRAGTSIGDGFKVYNNIFIDFNQVYYGGVGSAGFTNSEFKNNIVINVTDFEAGSSIENSGWVYQNNNFYNCGTWANTYVGSNGNINVDAQLDANYKPTVSTPTTVTEGGQTLTSVPLDADGVWRTAPYSMGAYETGTGTPPPSTSTYVFDGSSTDYFSTTLDMSTVSYQNISLVIRCKINNIANDWMTLLSIGSDEFSYQYNDDIFTALYSVDINGTFANDEQFHTWIITSNGTTATIYRDGTSVLSGTANTSDYGISTLLSIGQWNSSQYFDGEMTDVQVYDKVLTSTEISNLQTDITNVPSTNQVMILGATKSSTTWTDLSGNGNNATNAGGVVLN